MCGGGKNRDYTDEIDRLFGCVPFALSVATGYREVEETSLALCATSSWFESERPEKSIILTIASNLDGGNYFPIKVQFDFDF